MECHVTGDTHPLDNFAQIDFAVSILKTLAARPEIRVEISMTP